MKHVLLVGHFDTTVRSIRPKVIKPIDLDAVRAVLTEFCDREDGVPMLSKSEESTTFATHWLGRIGNEDILVKHGYLVCPWLCAGINQPSMAFLTKLSATCAVDIYQPDDAVFYSPEQLAHQEVAYSRPREAGIQRRTVS